MKTYSKYFLLALLLLLGIFIVLKANKKVPTLITIDSGVIEGIKDSTHEIRIFKGIPYAAPPVGDLRWKAPQPVQSWEGVRNCTKFAASAIQNEPKPFLCWSSEYLIPKDPIREDCLYLNVWTGANEPSERRPVLVYIHGGAFISGGSACPVYDGEGLAKKGIVVVNFNYRLGKFGYMAHPELSKESAYNSSGNYNLLDMVAALQWVQRNISAFGGNPDNVTIAGQSAGAVAVSYLTTSPLGKGLFHKAIAESGGASFIGTKHSRSAFSLDAAEQKGVAFSQALHCQSIAELRAKPASDILKATEGFDVPMIDGYVIQEDNLTAYQNGKQIDVPILLGWNKDDLEGGTITKAEFEERIQNRFGELSEEFITEYPSASDEEATQSLAHMVRDESIGIAMYTWAKMQAKTGKSKVFLYNFQRNLPGNSNGRDFGAFHSGEIPYAYHNLHKLHRPWTEIDYEISDVMSDYWVNFIKTGDPNSAGLPQWNAYDSVAEQVMVFDSIIEAKPLPTKAKMVLWEKYFRSNSR
ncbi:MAG: carboxylesterase family protein [Bacteroidota bacterium]